MVGINRREKEVASDWGFTMMYLKTCKTIADAIDGTRYIVRGAGTCKAMNYNPITGESGRMFIVLTSYDTDVAVYDVDDDAFDRDNNALNYSSSTTRHISEFDRQIARMVGHMPVVRIDCRPHERNGYMYSGEDMPGYYRF